jgi:predicted nuclease with TOPRIM domain
MTTAPNTNSWKGIMRRAGAAAVEQLENVAAMDQPQHPRVAPLLTTDQMQRRIREHNNRLVQIETECTQLEAEHERVRAEMIRLQEQMHAMHVEHMHGWQVEARLLVPLKERKGAAKPAEIPAAAGETTP